MKPLGYRSYGSIPHLPGSRLGTGDHHCHEGQARIATEKVRDKHDVVIVQEKLDGSNVGIAKVNGEILALTRAGYLASTSKYEQHHLFANWVDTNRKKFDDMLGDNMRVCGEWLAQAHGTRYKDLKTPFVAFDLMIRKERVPFRFFQSCMLSYDIPMVHTVSIGNPIPVETAMQHIDLSNSLNAIDPIEGCVYRVERKGAFDFIVKFVRRFKQDGIYLPEVSGQPPYWNWYKS